MPNKASVSLPALVFLLSYIWLAGCAAPPTPPQPPIAQATGESCVPTALQALSAGPALQPLYVQYRASMVSLFGRLRASLPINAELSTFNSNSPTPCVAIIEQKFGDKPITLMTTLFDTTTYNSIRTNFNSRAASHINSFGLTALKILLASDLVSDARVQSVGVIIVWGAKSFADASAAVDYETLSLAVPKQELADFVNAKITSQKMLDHSIILGHEGNQDLGRIEIDLKQAL